MLKTCAVAVIEARASEGVERDVLGLPTAFRIWRAGKNTVDGGEVVFTEASATLLMAEQTSRARPYSIDFDHLSLQNDRPAEAGRAAGYHALEVRNGELWATSVEWCADVRVGLAEQPPRWRYFSPAFFHNESDEVTSYINLALCINPVTHGIPLLASQKATAKHASRNTKEAPMTAEEMLAALDAMIAAEEDADKKATLVAAREALAAKKGEEAPAETAEKAEPEKAAAPPADEKEKEKETAAKHAASSDAVTSLTKKVLELERRAEVSEIDALLSKHATLPEEFKTHCRTRSLTDAKLMISAVGTTHSARKAAPSQGGATGAQGGASDPAFDALDRAMGITSATAQRPTKLEDGRFVMHNIRPSDLARLNAQKAKV